MATKTRKPPKRPKTGLGGVPTDSFASMKYYFHMDVEKKACSDVIKSYIKSNYPKKDVTFILQNPEYEFTMYTHFAAIAYWVTLNLDMDWVTETYKKGLDEFIVELLESGKEIAKQKAEEEKKPSNVIQLSIRDRLQNKVDLTVIEDLYDLEEKWQSGDDAEYDMYASYKAHVLPTTAIPMVLAFVEPKMYEYQAVYNKDDKQLVEGYSHLTRQQIKHRLDQYKKMVDDLNRLKMATKAIRQPRVKKPKAIDKQIAKVQFKKEDHEFKVASINPVKIVGAFRLYTFNTKTRALTELVTEDVNGFEISGTSIKNFDTGLSRSVKLRKPEEFLKIVLNKMPKQIDVEWKKLTTKTTAANGRLNVDTILLKVLSK